MTNKLYRFFTYACLVFIGVGMVSRFLLLGNGYEYDELFTAVTANPAISLGWIWDNYLMVDVHPPLYNIVMWVYNHFVPYGPELWMRLPSVFFGVLGMVLAWILFPKRYGKTAKLIFMAFLSCNCWLVFYTQHARAYAMMFCFAVPFNYLFINMAHWVRKGKQIGWKTWAWYGVLGLLLCWTHYFGAMAFGFFSLVLLGYAFKYKRNLWPFVVVPAVVTLLFLPWAIPNLLFNAGDNKFNGNWWANGSTVANILPNLIEFYFETEFIFLLMGLLFGVCLWKSVQLYKKGKPVAYAPDMGLFSLVCVLMLVLVYVVSFKMFLFFGRYFMAVMPAMLLTFAFCIVPYVRKNKWFAGWVLVCLSCLVVVGINTSRFTTARLYAGAKAAMEFYRDYAPEKELFVIAIEAFPPNSTQAMYSFYPNHVFKMNAKVTALYQLPYDQQLEALKRKENAIIWMPHCSAYKLRVISLTWKRIIGIEGDLGTSCFIRLADAGQTEPPAEWKKVKEEKVYLERQKDGTYDLPEYWKEMEEKLGANNEFHLPF